MIPKSLNPALNYSFPFRFSNWWEMFIFYIPSFLPFLTLILKEGFQFFFSVFHGVRSFFAVLFTLFLLFLLFYFPHVFKLVLLYLNFSLFCEYSETNIEYEEQYCPCEAYHSHEISSRSIANILKERTPNNRCEYLPTWKEHAIESTRIVVNQLIHHFILTFEAMLFNVNCFYCIW